MQTSIASSTSDASIGASITASPRALKVPPRRLPAARSSTIWRPGQPRLDRDVAPVDAAEPAAHVGRAARRPRPAASASGPLISISRWAAPSSWSAVRRQQLERQVALGAEIDLAIVSQRDRAGDEQRRPVAVQPQRLDAQARGIAGDGEGIGGDGQVAVAGL